ncbi:glycosyltransferase family 8 protein [Roseobacter ponti]|uniref:Glycosyltransferase family 8 protein n=1 Tax=Roseobacter ponti TaxID=1891787 RepID=A0A858SN57_9RHOB|nr:glycosyltransferase family 8 protein [Roseobacter ponti]QJF50279.1 glycosyltransferase family 8 protein [Roseobacter ponti]
MPVHVAVACDTAYAMPLAVLIASICATAGKAPIVIHIIHPGIDVRLRKRVERSLTAGDVSISWLPIAPERLEQFSATIAGFDHISIAAYYRLLLPELLPSAMGRVLYLDCDLVVMEDLADLWACSLKGALFAAVPELSVRASRAASPEGIYRPACVGMSPDQKLFNSGVMLIDLARWRAEVVAHRCFSYIKAAQSVSRWHDQEALNVVARGDWTALDARWNVTMHAFSKAADMTNTGRHTANPAIIHYNTSRKPWMAGFRGGFLRQFEDYLEQTDWRGTKPSPLSVHRRIFARARRMLSKARRKCRSHAAGMAASRRRWLSRIRRYPVSWRQSENDIRLFIRSTEAELDFDLAAQAGSSGIAQLFHVAGTGTGGQDNLRHLLEIYGRGGWCIVLPACADLSKTDWLRFREMLREKGCNACLMRWGQGSAELRRSQGYAWDAFFHRVVAGPVLFDPATPPETAVAASRVAFFRLSEDAAIGEDCTIIADAETAEDLIRL